MEAFFIEIASAVFVSLLVISDGEFSIYGLTRQVLNAFSGVYYLAYAALIEIGLTIWLEIKTE
ncbi:MAG: hypothetical protein GC152_01000 [Alphaproteobacteria bacterium]|nr:hypothetical protein [Alphaproteobacteria bacterium]